MMTVDEIITDILRREGGYVDDADDKGGATNRGISLKYMRGIGLDLDGDGDVDKDDVKLVTEEEARSLFKKDFFLTPRINTLPTPLHPFMFDYAVNSGPGRAIITLQETVNYAAKKAPWLLTYNPVVVDGGIGPKTRAATEQAYNAMGYDNFVNALVEARVSFVTAIVEADPTQRRFLKGWIKRAREFEV